MLSKFRRFLNLVFNIFIVKIASFACRAILEVLKANRDFPGHVLAHFDKSVSSEPSHVPDYEYFFLAVVVSVDISSPLGKKA